MLIVGCPWLLRVGTELLTPTGEVEDPGTLVEGLRDKGVEGVERS